MMLESLVNKIGFCTLKNEASNGSLTYRSCKLSDHCQQALVGLVSVFFFNLYYVLVEVQRSILSSSHSRQYGTLK